MLAWIVFLVGVACGFRALSGYVTDSSGLWPVWACAAVYLVAAGGNG